MARNQEFEGKDLDEALSQAATELGMAEPDLDYEILEQGRPGLFGLGTKNVRIRIIPPVDPELEPHEAPAAPEPPRETEPPPAVEAPPPPSAEVEQARSTVQRMFELMGLELETSVRSAEGGVSLQLGGQDSNALSRKDGELLQAMQFLLNRMSRRAWPGVGRIHLCADGERESRDDDLAALAREAGRQVRRSGRSKRLRPMNAYERRLIHMTVRGIRGVGSRSEGDGHLKRVRIFKLKKSGGE